MVLSQTPTRHHLTKSSRSVLAAADKATPKIRRAVLNWLDTVTIPNLDQLIASGNVATVYETIAALSPSQTVISAIVDATLTAAVAAATPEAATFGISMNDVNVRAIRWAESNAAKLVTGNIDQTPIRNLIVDATRRGIHPSVTARRIRDIVPLTGPHQNTVNRLWFGMLEDGIDEAHAEKIAGRKAAKLLRWRAETIARTEAIKSANMGQQVLWETATDMGLIPQGTKKVWLATGDDRTCTICAVMDGQTVALGGSFLVTEQATGFVRTGSTFQVTGTKPLTKPHAEKVPPAHPRCRCSLTLETL